MRVVVSREGRENGGAIDRDKLGAAFRSLRKQGLVALQSFSCCSGCAGCDLAARVGAMPEKKRDKFQGAVFYTKQDTDRLDQPDACLFLKYGPVEADGVEYGLDTEKVGLIVSMALISAGLEVEWNGDPHKSIRVRARRVPGVTFAVETFDGRWSRTVDDDGECRWPTYEAAEEYIARRDPSGRVPRRVVAIFPEGAPS